MPQSLAPTLISVDGTGNDLTGTLVASTNATISFQNTGREQLLVSSSTTTTTVTVNIGTTVLGEPVTSFSAVTLTQNHLYAFGPFHTQLNAPGGQTTTVTLNSTSGVTVGLIQNTGVY